MFEIRGTIALCVLFVKCFLRIFDESCFSNSGYPATDPEEPTVKSMAKVKHPVRRVNTAISI